MDELRVWERIPRRPQRRADLGALLRDARRGRAQRPVRHPRPPRPGEGVGAAHPDRPCPRAICAATTSRRSRRIAEAGIAVEVSTAGLRKPVQRDLSRAGVPGDVRRGRGAGRALERRPPARRTSAPTTTQALELLERVGVAELCVFERRTRRLEPIGAAWARVRARNEPLTGIGYDYPPPRGRPPADARRRRDPPRARPRRALRRRRAHPRGDRRAARRRRPGRHRRALPRHRRALARRRLDRAAGDGRGPRSSIAGLEIVNVDCTVVMEAPRLGPHQQAIRERLAGTLGLSEARVNVKATTGEGIGLRRPRRGRRGAGHRRSASGR